MLLAWMRKINFVNSMHREPIVWWKMKKYTRKKGGKRPGRDWLLDFNMGSV